MTDPATCTLAYLRAQYEELLHSTECTRLRAQSTSDRAAQLAEDARALETRAREAKRRWEDAYKETL